MELGKPIFSPVYQESEPQGKQRGVWVKDCRGCECFAVMAWIRIATLSYAKAGGLLHGDSLQET
jgi:hypothetical protein